MNITLYNEIKNLSDKYTTELRSKINDRIDEMKSDDNSHYLIYRVLGITESEGNLIDIYQNKGRFVYKYAGSFLEEAAILCLKHKYPNGKKTKIPNALGKKPATYEIDFLNKNDALEIKWRDATTDGDHITKEHTRVKTISLKKTKANPCYVLLSAERAGYQNSGNIKNSLRRRSRRILCRRGSLAIHKRLHRN